MAKESMKARERKRAKMVAKYAEKRAALKAAGDWEGLQKLPPNSAAVRMHNRCQITGRPRGYMRQFGISRVLFRKMALTRELEKTIDPEIGGESNDNVLTFTRPSGKGDHRFKARVVPRPGEQQGGRRIQWIHRSFELVGVGFRALCRFAGQDLLTLALGFSHQIVMRLPEEIKVKAETKKGENPT